MPIYLKFHRIEFIWFHYNITCYGGSIFSFLEIGKSTDEEMDDEELFSDFEEE